MGLNTVGHKATPALQTSLTATGSTQGTAFPLTNNTVHEFTSVPASSGAIMPIPTLPSQVTITNGDTNTLTIYPQVGGTFTNGSVNASVTLAAGSSITYFASSLSNWYALVTATGGTGSPGGSSGQIQYDNAGSFGGFTASGDATIDTSTGAIAVKSILTPTAVKTATTYTAVVGDDVPVDTTSNAVTVTLPTAPANRSQIAVAMVSQGSTNAVTVATGGSDVFSVASGATSLVLPYLFQRKVFQYQATGAIWNIIGSYDACTDAGDYVSASIASGSQITLTTVTYANVTSISLPPGDWDVGGAVDYTLTSATVTQLIAGSSTTSATIGGQDSNTTLSPSNVTANVAYTIPIPSFRYNLATTTTVYLIARAQFSAGTVVAYGTLRARRWR